MKRLVCLLLVILLLSLGVLTWTSCSARGCQACAGRRIRGCFACSLEKYGECVDCTGFVCSACMGEDCADTCYVVPCYVVANGVRRGNASHCGCQQPISLNGLSPVPETDYIYTVATNPLLIPNLSNHYRVEYTVTVTAKVDLSNVVISFEAFDVNGNHQENITLFVASKIKAGDYNGESATITLTFTRGDENSSERRISIFNNEYSADIRNVKVYAKQ